MSTTKKVVKEKVEEVVEKKEEETKEAQKPTLRELYGEKPPLHILNKLS